ncbi:ABC-three component system protein [Thalassospira lucentensis]|uniref:ABC-three component system protein n=1 Tax=Thalassospira lucentensis TaxID=168935 RepID=UPI002941DFC7|nr:ABC-three component system protein [Thalassospira lucentensis]WOI12890.1 ABC-three component system protein [Thalassospira lucentensis]
MVAIQGWFAVGGAMNKADFNQYFDLAFSKYNQTEFEEWFAKMAACVYGTDFEVIKAGGKHGDKKSDGRLISQETVFQCYAPESSSTFAQNAKTKILDSFPDVTKFWPKLKKWVLVHNNEAGLPTSASDVLENLRQQFPAIDIVAPSPRRFLKDNFHDKLTVQQLIDIYPSASLNFMAVTMEHIRPLLRQVMRHRKTAQVDLLDFGEVPDEEKLDFNSLSPDAKFVLKRARSHVDVVRRYLSGMSNPNNVSILQEQMRLKYEEAKDLGDYPDEILGKLLKFVGGDGTPTVDAAAYVILAYFFDACDIFENVPDDALC